MDILGYWQTCCVPFVRARLNMKSERGASLVEYALLVALIAVVCLVALKFLGTSTGDKINTVGKDIRDSTSISAP